MIKHSKVYFVASILISLCLLWTPNVWAAANAGTPQLKKMVKQYALFTDGSLWKWDVQNGKGTMSKMDLDQVVDISHNMTQWLALREDGTVWSWGINYYGELGDDQITPPVVGEVTEGRSEPRQIKSLSDVIAISAATYFSMALKRDGTVWTWGGNRGGGLADGGQTVENPVEGAQYFDMFDNKKIQIQPSKDRFEPGKVETLTDIIAIDNYGQGGVALKSDGTVWAWGFLIHQYSPYQIPNLNNVKSIEDTFAETKDGTVWGWGPNDRGQYGNGIRHEEPRGDFIPEPTLLAALDDFEEIEVGILHTLGLKNGVLYAWGGNDNGSLGNGTTTVRKYADILEDHDSLTPVEINGLPEIQNVWTDNVSFGGIALGVDGSIWKWGGYTKGDDTPKRIEFVDGPLAMPQNPNSVEHNTGSPVAASNEITVMVNGKTLSLDQPPIEVGGRIKLPLRAIFDALGATTSWDNSTNTVTAIKGDTTVTLTTGQFIAKVNNKKITLDQPADIMNNRILVPVRFVTESFGGDISYEKDIKTVKILIP